MKTLLSVCAISLALTASTKVHAQDSSLSANFGEVRLRAGFAPDPHQLRLTAGGEIDANKLGGRCTGMISDAPDYKLHYSAGSLPLVFRTISSADTTLVINGPDGSWDCDDDSFGDGDAEVRFYSPQSGVYDIWVGTFGGGMESATLQITESP